ncbi:hypothetical protein G210_2150 [Candida maltosa Xu316]|uniref:Ribosome biogenesis protein SLX9 n=1 Tax=Candida maltosa (strain Xu316) TaxID=1245528 RepID=M3HSP4_CANMX|nr:hypothetical protein G210_2150 [Candida maltosa Xu316]
MAGIKKKSSLRDKSFKKSQLAKVSEFKQELAESQEPQQEEYHENPFLKLAKSTKREKQQVKSENFTNKILQGERTISKSSLRRRKRKERENLKPKLNDLLSNLPDDTSKQEGTGTETRLFIKKVKKSENKPNPTKASGIKQIFKQESALFKTALQNRDDKFSSLREMIQQNMKK